MAIIVDRSTGNRISEDPDRQQCNDMLWAVFQAFAAANPDMIREAVEDYQANNALRH